MIEASNINDLKKQLKNTKRPWIVKSKDDEFNRQVIEQKLCNILVLQHQNRRHSIKNIDSGLNNVIANIATKNKISVGFDIEKIQNMEKKEKAQNLSSIVDNLKTLRKSKTNLTTIKGAKEYLYLLLSLGSSTEQAKRAISQSF